MAGQLIRTPYLQTIITEITKLKLSKTIAFDECHSLGALLYNIFNKNKKQFENLKNLKFKFFKI